MKIFKQSFVGIKPNIEKGEVAPLAFLVPYEDNAAGRKRIETVDLWLNGYSRSWDKSPKIEGKIYSNTPMSGFKIVGWADRWSTDNKTARILDPRGFMLEIYIPNLVAIIQDTTIVKGEIKDELIWAREGANNALISTKSEEYKTAWFEGKNLTQSVGDIVRDGKGIEYQYLGKRRYSFIGKTRKQVPNPNLRPGNWVLHRDVYQEDGGIVYNNPMKEMHIYLCKSVPAVGYYSSVHAGEVVLRTGVMKVEAILGNEEIDIRKPFKVPYDRAAMYHNADGTQWSGHDVFRAEEIVVHD